MARPKQERLSKAAAKQFAKKAMGSEPTFATNQIETDLELLKAFNWYSSMHDLSTAKQWIAEYAVQRFGQAAEKIANCPDTLIHTAYGWMARMVARGIKLPDSNVQRLEGYVTKLVAEVPVTDRSGGSRTDKTDTYLVDFDDALDRLDPDFDPYDYLNTNSVSHIYAGRIARYYYPVFTEMMAAATKADPEAVEAYRNLTAAELFRNLLYIHTILTDCERYVGNVRKERKPRKVRQKTSDQILKHFVYADENQALKIKSINPASIIGAERLWVLNTSNKIMTMFVAKEGGLQVHRTAITNYDPEKTKSKRVGRKIETVIQTVLIGSKRDREKVLDTVGSEFVNTTDRINSSVVLLRSTK